MKKEKYGFVYIWFDSNKSSKRNKNYRKYYIGSHWGTEDDGYICSSNWMRNAYKRRPQDFKRRILHKIYTDRKELLIKEHNWLSLIKKEELGKRYYNFSSQIPIPNGGGFISNETRKIWSEQRKGRIPWNKGIPMLDAVKIKVSESCKGSHSNNITSFKNGRTPWNLNLHHTEESINKIKESRAKQIITEESNLKRSKTLKGRISPMKGRKWSKESIAKRTETKKKLKEERQNIQ